MKKFIKQFDWFSGTCNPGVSGGFLFLCSAKSVLVAKMCVAMIFEKCQNEKQDHVGRSGLLWQNSTARGESKHRNGKPKKIKPKLMQLQTIPQKLATKCVTITKRLLCLFVCQNYVHCRRFMLFVFVIFL